jgi:hypothetical protein
VARIQGASIRIEAELLGAASYHMNMLAFLLNVIAPAVNLRSALLSPSRCFLSSAPALSFTAGAILRHASEIC